jgi:GNAT superfamily N-acetyltransferase/acyl carrier protein
MPGHTGSLVDTADIRNAVTAAIESIAPEAARQPLEPGRPLRGQVDLDSLDWLNVLAALHERLGVDIPESDFDRLSTLDGIVACVEALRREHAAGAWPRVVAPTAPLPDTSRVINGTRVRIRPMRADDRDLEAEFVRHLSGDARYKRFMATMRELSDAKLKYLTDVDQDRHVALVATVDIDGRQVEVGVARYVVDPVGTGCEFAIAVDDAWQGSGLAGILMHALMGVARSRGIASMEGTVLAANSRMLHFTRLLGFNVERDPDDMQTLRVIRAL